MGVRGRLRYVGWGALTSDALPMTGRLALLRRLGATVGSGCEVWPSRVLAPERLTLGDHVFVNYDCLLDAAGGLTIGDRVSVGARVTLLTTTHALVDGEQRAGDVRRLPTSVGRGSWLGAGCLVMPGVTIADGTVVAAGAVVTRDTEPGGVYAGMPARKVERS